MEEEDYDDLQNHSENDPDLTGPESVIADNTRMLFESAPQEKLPAGEKDRIWNRVIAYAQIPKADTGKRLFRLASWYRVAAVVTLVLLAGVGYKLLKRPASDVMKQAAASVSIESTETRLMLADSRTINLKGENSDVVYQHDLIRIDSSGVEKNVSPAQKHGLNTLVVPYGKRSRITLSDGTKIWLNSGSRLVYPSEFAEGNREVYLDGQAYFAVAHDTDRPFYVQTDHMDIKVLGTEFDISSYGDDNKVSAVLAKGSIELLTQKDSFWGGQRSKMVPGTRAVYDEISRRAQIDKVNVDECISWKDGYLIAHHQTLNEVFKKLSRYYKYDFTIRDAEVGLETFSGYLDLHEDIDQMVISLADATSLKYHKSERRLIFEKKDISPE
ncbi:FecR family protein [Dyadobacter soli]|uniref:FecR family protein n=1 Tax=Dyadobacter soli TaxID=659014 RepID=A0A1G7VLL6_9BACT|nr:FecR domain-containing protein [Dyadobacter soli]SDG60587.1 FecR family protein [Dyadobacter soli]